MQFIHQRTRVSLTHAYPLIGRASPNGRLYGVQPGNALQRLRSQRPRQLLVLVMDIVELPAHMRPARRLQNHSGLARRFIQCIEPSVAIGLQDATKRLELLYGVVPFAIR